MSSSAVESDLTAPFVNEAISLEDLPRYEQVALASIDRRFLWSQLFSHGSIWVLLIAVSDLGPRLWAWPIAHQWWLPLLLALLALVDGVIVWRDARARGWALRTHELLYRYGVIWRHEVIVPFVRIQHVETLSGPVERAFGLCRLRLFTSGGSGGDLDVLGLTGGLAKSVKKQLIDKIGDDQIAHDPLNHPKSD